MNSAKIRALVLFSGSVVAVTAGSASAQIAWHATIDLHTLHQHATGAGILVGQIESGTPETRHVSLDAGTPGSKVQYLFSQEGVRPNSDHATHVASIIAGRPNSDGGAFTGVAYNATLASSNLIDPTGAPDWEDSFLSAMTDFFRVAPTTPIINMSAGFTVAFGASTRLRSQQAADWMGDTGYLFVVAAGNEGSGASTLRSPGSGFNVLTVGATGGSGHLQNYDRIADYSSRGAATVGGGSRMKPDLVAPGSRIYSAVAAPDGGGNYNQFSEQDGGGNWISGTSFATPIVSGVAACLHEWGRNHGLSRDPRVMRAVLMNSTSKAVENDAGTRWDRIPGLGKGAASISLDLGTGQLDAGQAWRQYRAGQHHVNAGAVGLVPELGFDLSNVSALGVGPSYGTMNEVRKGSYMTSTLCWNRPVTSGYNANDGTNNWANWSYGTLDNLDISVAKLGDPMVLQTSNATDGTSEHSVFKTPDRDRYTHRIDTPGIPSAPTQFGFAWEYTSAPTYTKEYNGCFTGNSHGNYLDDGWYGIGFGAPLVPTISKPTWVPNDNDAWALKISSSVEAGQELWNPLDTFTIEFKYGFSADNGTQFQAKLGSLSLFDLAGIPGGVITPDVTNTGMYKMFSLTLNRAQLAPLTGDYVELSFVAFGGPDDVFIDCVKYVPTPASGVLTLAGILTIGARRRRA